jgi:nicotinamidase-related amidase
LIKGFTTTGALASPRIQSIVPAVVDLFRRAHALGVRHFLLAEDTHEPDAIEFSTYPRHCVAGSEESKTIDALTALPFSERFVHIPKNSISSSLGTRLPDWLAEHTEVNTFIVVGDCTDICVYNCAIDLRVRANVLGMRQARVIVPADCVQTYDTPVAVAEELGILAHDGDLMHRIFLYHLALNGVEIYSHLG